MAWRGVARQVGLCVRAHAHMHYVSLVPSARVEEERLVHTDVLPVN